MIFKRALTGAISGTTLMTAFSYAVTKATGKNFIEPVILGELLHRIAPIKKPASKIIGWTAHYGVGLFFDLFYEEYLQIRRTSPNLMNTALLGSISGLTGIAVWHATFKAHPNPPGVDLKNFYKQLFIAHLVFAVGTALMRKAIDKKNDVHKPFPQPLSDNAIV
ncbi:hypothetical protein MUY27_05620 [Mucilaginibacter sp. RS28]|uniref:DUF1440 domain-containing protein n=1 Tax=Mucilaginibacter straminoryzae TaxID=2932774 RepID=A0A9X2BAU7_9SPHI|nr:hypothetical protein [Mucilaginibacter straminoryzae]MCJ8209177.1 hypothetical protein [Mucilaginibacter straminoryzae]